MPAPSEFTFSFQEIVELLIRKAGVTDGHWGLQVRFGLNAANVGSSDTDLRPAAVIPIMDIGIRQYEKPTNLSLDAAEVAKKSAS
jgi:hypothetical protein